MSDSILKDMATRLLHHVTNHPADQHWALVDEFGLANLLLPEAQGGFDGKWRDASTVFELLGQYHTVLPVGETLLARKYLWDAGREPPDGPIDISYCADAFLEPNGSGWFFSGTLDDITKADQCVLEVFCDGRRRLVLIDAPMGTCQISRTPVSFITDNDVTKPGLFHAAALLRAAQMSGSMMSALDLSINYVKERSQFGRSLAKFQVIQHDLARMAEQVASVSCAVEAASLAAEYDAATFEIGAAKLRANMATPLICTIAHQVHGAIGFTREHALHRFTGSINTWRGEFGNDRYWSNILGKLALATNESTIWEHLTARSDIILENL